MYRLRLLRAVLIEGKRWLPGAELQADAVAAALIRDGTARLFDDADLPRLIAAHRQASRPGPAAAQA